MAELLIELFSEEIPARMQAKAAADLERIISGDLMDAGLTHSAKKSFATPRRLTLVIDGLAEAQPDRKEERKGPKVGAPEKALNGFLGSVGLTIDQCEKRETPKGEFYFAVMDHKGRPTADVIAEILPKAIRNFPWPKSQRWGEGSLRWVRPLHTIICVFNGEVVPFSIENIDSGNTTRGHRFLSPDAFSVGSFEDYSDKLAGAHVMLNGEDRADEIHEAVKNAAFAEGFELVEDPGLLAEVSGLVEWPTVLSGAIDDEFMDVPDEVLTSSMRAHQKYFSVRNPKTGKLAPRFIFVSNNVATDGGKTIISGNERVLRARLSDAKFFWDLDCKQKLETRVDGLGAMIFHAKLGTNLQRVHRIEALAGKIAGMIGADETHAKRAAKLAKADLITEMVGEFPELQGLMGRYYALNDGEDDAVANAIRDHYAPQGPGDSCPTDKVAIAVSLADKIDTLAGFFGIDEKPTGSKDPYALRRAALGVIRLVLENGLRVRLLDVFTAATDGYDIDLRDETGTDLLDFLADRLKVYLKDQGLRHDLIASVFALGGQDDLVQLVDRVKALQDFVGTDDGINLLAGYRRAANILKIEEKKDSTDFNNAVDPALLSQGEEIDLASKLEAAAGQSTTLADAEDFVGAMAALAQLRGPVDAFFDEVTVNTDEAEVRVNRLRLLSGIRNALHGIADFDTIEG